MKSWTSKALAGIAATSATLALAAVPAGAAPPKTPAGTPATLKVVRTLSAGFVGPLQFAVAGNQVLVADSFFSTLSQLGRKAPIATGPSSRTGGDVAGVAIDAKTGAIAYTTTNGNHSRTNLTILRKNSRPVVADLSGFEKKYNPDGRTTYGVDHPSSCVIKAFAAGHRPANYRGEVDSHPYAVAALPGGAWAVADAGGNDILKVDRLGRVSLLAVLPVQPVKITAAFAKANHLPSCAVGVTYKFEPVPTDVEVGRTGLYVTTLPGGPEGPGSGNPGSVYKMANRSSGRYGQPFRIATGFAGATNLAISPIGNIYVAEIGAGRISKVVHGKPQTMLRLPGVVAVEQAGGHLFASTAPAATGGKAPGTIVQLAVVNGRL